MQKIKYITGIYDIKHTVKMLKGKIDTSTNSEEEKEEMLREIEEFSSVYDKEDLRDLLENYFGGDNRFVVLCEKYGQVNYLKQKFIDILGDDNVNFYFFNPRYLNKSLDNFVNFMKGEEKVYHILFHAGESIETPEISKFICIRTENGNDFFNEQIKRVSEFNGTKDLTIIDFANNIDIAGNCINIKRDMSNVDKKRIELFDHCSHILEFFYNIKGQLRTSWDDIYDELVKFKETHGHCCPPKSNKKLNNWVSNQRVTVNEMSDDRRFKLDRIGFCWEYRDELWNLRFDELVAYKNEYGNIKVKKSHNEGRLFEWLNSQKSKYNNKILSQERIDKLDSIGFCWKSKEEMLEEQWSNKLKELIEFKKTYGNTNVKRTHEGLAGLRAWVNSQKTLYNNGELKQKRIDKLNAIEFCWCEKERKSTK